jgi:glycosyltransferase involved in cell wall biosynthesis
MQGEAVTPKISAIVLTFNEEKNLPDCLESLGPLSCEIFVVDSGSTDATRAIAERFGGRVFVHPFESHARQWRWALESLPLATEWVLAVDADQRLSRELAAEIEAARLDGTFEAADGFFLPRRQIFRGRWIRHGGYYPKYLLKLFRRSKGSVDEAELVDHHFLVEGTTAKMHGDLVEDNKNELDISAWIEKHNRYAALQAQEELRCASARGSTPSRILGNPDERVAWLKSRWRSLPLFVRPFLYFGYRYVFRLGFLDGREGLIFHFLQGCWYRFLVDVYVDQERRGAKALRRKDDRT